MLTQFVCSRCGRKYSLDSFAFQCECGGMLDLDMPEFSFSDSDIVKSDWSIFRYRKALPFDSNIIKEISLGEGMTPVLPLKSDDDSVFVKVEYMMPTLSFKDRGAAVLVAKAKELGVKNIIEDSSGNAGCSIAAYAARAGIKCDIYLPQGTSPKKIKQISCYDANVHVVNGNREDTAAATLEAVKNGAGFYASHVYNPLFYQGTKTYAYEIYEQFHGNIPDNIFIPLGNGTLVLGAYYGFKELFENKLIVKMPKIIAVQAQKCPPIQQAFTHGDIAVSPVDNKGTMAEGIAIAAPMRGAQVLAAVRAVNGEIILAPEDKILPAHQYLAQKGFYVEITSAATFAAFFKYRESHPKMGSSILPLCGAGLKTA